MGLWELILFYRVLLGHLADVIQTDLRLEAPLPQPP